MRFRSWACLACGLALSCGGTLGQREQDAASPDGGAQADAIDETNTPAFMGYLGAGTFGYSTGGFTAGFALAVDTEEPLLEAGAGKQPLSALAGCAGPVSGSCCLRPTAVRAPFSASADWTASAGQLTIASGSQTLAVLTPDPDAGGRYPDAPYASWRPGQELAMSAAGDAVHAFSGSVVAPGPAYHLSPPLEGNATIAVPRSSDWTLTWTADVRPGETMVLSISDDAIWCAVADSDEKLVVSSQLLGMLHAGSTVAALHRYAITTAQSDNAVVALFVDLQLSGSIDLQ